MNKNIQTVKKFFSDDEYAIGDMREYTKKHLKKWETEVIAAFPPKAKILDVGCDMGREAFTIDELTHAATKAGLNIIDCQRGSIYTKEDGTILHCECRK